MTIAKHIAVLRGLIRQYSETETPFSDEYLYQIFNAAALRLIRQKLDRNMKLSAWNDKMFCIALEAATIHDCDCLPSCTVLKSKYKIPKPMTTRNRDMIKVHTLDHRCFLGNAIYSICAHV